MLLGGEAVTEICYTHSIRFNQTRATERGKEMTVKYENITIPLSGEDGNAFGIIARCRKAMTRAGLPQEEVEAFTAEAKAGDYDHLLATVMAWFDFE